MSFPPIRTCNCGSGNPKYSLVDARGIFLTYACDACEAEKLRTYRSEVLDDPNYQTEEPIDDN